MRSDKDKRPIIAGPKNGEFRVPSVCADLLCKIYMCQKLVTLLFAEDAFVFKSEISPWYRIAGSGYESPLHRPSIGKIPASSATHDTRSVLIRYLTGILDELFNKPFAEGAFLQDGTSYNTTKVRSCEQVRPAFKLNSRKFG